MCVELQHELGVVIKMMILLRMQRPSWHIWFLDAQSESILHSEILIKLYYEIELSNQEFYINF